MLVNDALWRRSSERRLAGEHFEQHARQAVQIAAAVCVTVARRLLRTHVRRGAKRHSCSREALSSRRRQRPGNTKSGHDRVSRFEQDVLRLDVPVHNAVRMSVGQCVAYLVRDAQRVVKGQLLLTV